MGIRKSDREIDHEREKGDDAGDQEPRVCRL
jgi:hypothetical protein